ncbi:MAG: hypothetical protein EOO01_42865, partial [Chitinophagaceae bacterium]
MTIEQTTHLTPGSGSVPGMDPSAPGMLVNQAERDKASSEEFRNIFFGQNVIGLETGMVREGDEVVL